MILIGPAANGRISSAVDVMRDLVRRGINQEEFLPRTELGEGTPAVIGLSFLCDT